MATTSASASASASFAKSSPAFMRFAGISGVLTAISSLLYAVFFLLVKGSAHELLPPLLLAIGGLLASAVLTALYGVVRDADPLFALWALALGLLGQLGALIHGVHDLSLVLVPAPANAPDLTMLPNQLDPRGLLAFGLTGLSTFILSWLVVRSGALPRGLGYLGYVLGILLVALFLGNVFTNDPSSLFILVPRGLASLLANPAWLLWLGLALLRQR
jgi:Domain of unknown function (DUF4386)